MPHDPMKMGFSSKQQEERFKRENPKFYRLIMQRFGSYNSAKHLKALKQQQVNHKGR